MAREGTGAGSTDRHGFGAGSVHRSAHCEAGALSSYVVPSDEGPHRKYYAVTPAGREALRNGTKTWSHPDFYAEPAFDPPVWQLSQPDGSAITNIYAYDTEDEPIDGVLLYDQHGRRPIELGDAVDPATGQPLVHVPVLDVFGLPVGNLHPVDQHTVTWGAEGRAEARQPVPRPEVELPSLPPALAPDGATDADDATGPDRTGGSPRRPLHHGCPGLVAAHDGEGLVAEPRLRAARCRGG